MSRITQSSLAQFIGTSSDEIAISGTPTHPIMLTTGLQYLKTEAGIEGLIDLVAESQQLAAFQLIPFQVWKFNLAGVEQVQCECPIGVSLYSLCVEDGNGNMLGDAAAAVHRDPYDIEPDADGMLVLWFENETLMLPSER